MIHWLWLIPAVVGGAVIGVVLTCAVAAKRREEWDSDCDSEGS